MMSHNHKVLKETVLYERNSMGVHVRAYQQVVHVPVEGGEEGQVTEKKLYFVDGSLHGKQIKHVEGPGYRQTIFAGRKMYQEIYDEHVKPVAEKSKQEAAEKAAAEKEQKAAERKAAAEAKAAERERKLAEKKAELEAKAAEKARKQSEKEAAAKAKAEAEAAAKAEKEQAEAK